MHLIKTLFFACLLVSVSILPAQDTIPLSLTEVVELAQGEAPLSLIARTRLSNNYWQYQSFLADYKPRLAFEGTLPNLNRSLDVITLPNGQDIFIQRSQMSSGVGINLRQNIPQTGGTVFARSGLRRLDIFKSGNNPGTTSYLNTPFSIFFIQPIFGFNELKWDRDLEKLRYKENQRGYSEDLEDVAVDAVELFFNVLISQLTLDASLKNRSNADTLLKISQGRFGVGRISETELLQIELSAMNANAEVAAATLQVQSFTEQLRNYLGVRRQVRFTLDAPEAIPTVDINVDTALIYATRNRSDAVNFERRLLDAESEVARAKRNRVDVNLSGTFGLSQTGADISESYQDLLDQEQISLGVSFPIADWGKTKADREIARSNQQLVQMQVEQDRVSFQQEVLLNVQQYTLVRNQVQVALRAYEVAQKREDLSRQRYFIGTISITDLTIAVRELNDARQGYYSSLRNFWRAYYELRRLTLFDFIENKSLVRSDTD